MTKLWALTPSRTRVMTCISTINYCVNAGPRSGTNSASAGPMSRGSVISIHVHHL